MFGGIGWSNYGHDGVKDIFNLKLDEIGRGIYYGLVSISFCLESFFGAG